MKILLVGAAATALGLGGGALVAGTLLKGDIVQRLEQENSASAAARTAAARASRPGIEASGSTAVQTSVDLSANQPAAGEVEEDTSGSGGVSEPASATSGDLTSQSTGPAASAVEGGEPNESVSTATSRNATAESTGPDGSATDGGPRVDPEASRKLAKIFGAMRPDDAAAVLQGMEDSEVRGILMSMNERQAAAILGGFEIGRAAALSQLVLLTSPNGG